MPNPDKIMQAAAARLLPRIRNGRDHPTTLITLIKTMCGNMEQGGFTPEDIGTTEEEIRALTKGQRQKRAGMLLKQLRNGSSDVESLLRLLREDLIAGKLTLEDIKTSRQELESFKLSRQTKCHTTILDRTL